jgi:hypothetical protein
MSLLYLSSVRKADSLGDLALQDACLISSFLKRKYGGERKAELASVVIHWSARSLVSSARRLLQFPSFPMKVLFRLNLEHKGGRCI